MEKQKIEVFVKTGDFEQAKELLTDLEVLNEKYEVSFQMIMDSPVFLQVTHPSAYRDVSQTDCNE